MYDGRLAVAASSTYKRTLSSIKGLKVDLTDKKLKQKYNRKLDS